MKVFTDTSRLDRLIANIPGNTSEAIKAVGFQVEALAKMKAPIDTGALRNSIYVRTKTSNPKPNVSTEDLPQPQTDESVVIGPSVEYAIYQELGTSFMEAQPFLIPALQDVERQLEESFGVLANE